MLACEIAGRPPMARGLISLQSSANSSSFIYSGAPNTDPYPRLKFLQGIRCVMRKVVLQMLNKSQWRNTARIRDSSTATGQCNITENVMNTCNAHKEWEMQMHKSLAQLQHKCIGGGCSLYSTTKKITAMPKITMLPSKILGVVF